MLRRDHSRSPSQILKMLKLNPGHQQRRNLRKTEWKNLLPRTGETSIVPKKKFLNEERKNIWKTICEYEIIVERVINVSAFEKYGLTELLTDKGLIKIAMFAKTYSPTLVQEFYNSLSPAIKTPTTRGY